MVEDLTYSCAFCSASLKQEVGVGNFIARQATCPACSADLHCCKQCTHFDQSSYNECSESQADRVVDKDRANFCDYFKIYFGVSRATGKSPNETKKSALAALDDLFKK